MYYREKLTCNAQKAAQLQQQTLIAKLKEQLNQLMNVQQSTMYEVTDSIPINMRYLWAISRVIWRITTRIADR